MKKGRVSFRGCRIGLLGCNEQDGATLSRQLHRLGALAEPRAAVTEADLGGETGLSAVFWDSDGDLPEPAPGADLGRRAPVVVLIGSETPSTLGRIARLSPSAYLMKPVRSFGVMTALSFARTNFAARAESEQRIARLEARLRSRRFVVAAQLRLMRDHGLTEAAAFERLRGAAMDRRTTIEAISVEFVAGSTHVIPPEYRLGHGWAGPGLESEGDER